jgi:hypothetical protein
MTVTDSRRMRLGRLESLAALAGGVTHEMNNLAASVTMSAQLLEPSCTDPSGRQVLASLHDLALRLQHAGRQLHWLARGVAGEPTLFQPQYLLADLQKLARVAFPPDVTLITRYPPDLWPLAGEPLLVFQLLLALCLEARDHLPEGGTLVLAARNHEIGESGDLGRRSLARAPGRGQAKSAPPGRYVVLEAVAEPSEPEEAAAEFDASSGAGATGDHRRAASARQQAAAARRRRRKASEAGRAAAAAGGFTEPLSQGKAGKAARGRRAYLPAARIDEQPKA